MEKDGTEAKQVDLKFIQEKLDIGYKYSEEAELRDLILVIGNTGVGKSTTCNYLLGYAMEEAKYKSRSVIETVGKSRVKIGHQVAAETLYAKSLPINDPNITGKVKNRLCLLDCPGFYGNRTIEEKVIESVSIELAIRNAKQIKGILILISINTLLETKLGELRDLVKTLISLFEDPVEMVQHSIFIITKKYKNMPYKEAKETTIGAIELFVQYCREQASLLFSNPNLSSAEGLMHTDYDTIASYFSVVLTHKESNIIFINPLDKGESRKLIFKRINGIKPRKGKASRIWNAGISMAKYVGIASNEEDRPITIKDFNFTAYDQHRKLFDKALCYLAGDGYKLMDKIIKDVENVQKYLFENADLEERLVSLRKEKSAIYGDLQNITERKSERLKISFEAKNNWKLLIVRNNQRILSTTSQLVDIREKKEQRRKELKAIDNDEPLLFTRKSMSKLFSVFKTYEEMVFFTYTDDPSIPFIDVQKEMKYGKWIDEEDQRSIGFYKVKYRTIYYCPFLPLYACVRVYIRTRDDVGNRINIEHIKGTIAQLEKEIKCLELEILDLESYNKLLQTNIDNIDTDAKEQENILKRELVKCEHNIEFYESKIVKNKEVVEEIQNSGLKNLKLFHKNNLKYDILVKVILLLKLESSLMKVFVPMYNSFVVQINNYHSYFNKKGTIDLSNLNTEEKIYGLKDPITGKEIKDLAVTREGTVFDVHSLLQQFDISNSEKVQPFEFKRNDGKIEVIEYRSWYKMDKQQYKEHSETHLFSSHSSTMFIKSKMDEEELGKQKDKLLQEIHAMEEELEIKNTELEVKKADLENICRKLETLQLNAEDAGEIAMLEQDVAIPLAADYSNDVTAGTVMTEDEQIIYA